MDTPSLRIDQHTRPPAGATATLRRRSAAAVLPALVALVALPAACKRHPERTAEGALSRLHDALASHNPPIERVADTQLVNEADYLNQVNLMSSRSFLPLGPTAIESALSDIRTRGEPDRFFAGVLPLLRQGHCERIAAAPLPDPVRTTPPPNDRWPARALELQRTVARRLQGAFAGDYLCDGGPSFRAMFSRADPDDGALRVAYIGPSSVR